MLEVYNGATVSPNCALSSLMPDLTQGIYSAKTSVDEAKPSSNSSWALMLIVVWKIKLQPYYTKMPILAAKWHPWSTGPG